MLVICILRSPLLNSPCGGSPSLLNLARPINRLPPEVLSSIFRLITGPIKVTDLRDVLRLNSICHNRRAIVLQDDAVRSNICLTNQDPSFIIQ